MSTTLTTIRWLSIFTGALSLFYLGHAWFDFGLGEVFQRIYAWYAGILHPLVEVLNPVALWVLGLLGWSLPVWWKDAVVLYFSVGGASTRGRPLLRREVERHESYVENMNLLFALAAPLIWIFWPVLWTWDLMVGFREDRIDVSSGRKGLFVLSAMLELAKMVSGAVLFAALNAGIQ